MGELFSNVDLYVKDIEASRERKQSMYVMNAPMSIDPQSKNERMSCVYTLSRRSPPDINAILRIVGPWLFDAGLNDAPDYIAGRSQAIRVLGKLICQPAGGYSNGKKILQPHAIRFLCVVFEALEQNISERVTVAALFGCVNFFSINSASTLPANELLAGMFHRAIKQAFHGKLRYVVVIVGHDSCISRPSS